MKKIFLFCAGVLAVAAVMVAPSPLSAKALEKVTLRPPAASVGRSASDVVRGFYSALVATMKEGDALKFNGRYTKLQPSFNQAFDLDAMTRLAVGPSWLKASPEQKERLVSAFRHFSLSNYVSQFKSFGGEVFEVVGEKPGARAGDVVVETTLTSGADKNQLNYLMHRNGRGWQIVDVFVNGAISEMATRRSEFGSVVRTGGVDALLGVLEQKSKALADS